MPAKIAVNDLKIGMFIRLELGWMSHPFPLSSFRVTSAEQIATIASLGLREVTWLPEKSDLAAAAAPQAEAASDAASARLPEQRAAAQRREQLHAQRESLRLCEDQYGEAQASLGAIESLLDAAPEQAARRAEALVGAMLDKMLGEHELCIRLLSANAGERTTAHALNVAVVSLLMGRALALSDGELADIGTGALLHDVGKRDLPPRVRYDEERFTGAEVKAYREHVALGAARARRMGLAPGAQQIIAQHHELADGSGFPGRCGLDAMSPGSRVVALVNRFDNLCNGGPRSISLTPHEAVSTLFAQCRTKFDVPILSSFIRMMGVYPAGSVVQLTDERYAMVMQVNSSRPLKPRVLVHDPKVPHDEALFLDLEQCTDLGIRRSLAPNKLPPAAAAYLAPRPRVTYYFDVLPAPVHDEARALEAV